MSSGFLNPLIWEINILHHHIHWHSKAVPKSRQLAFIYGITFKLTETKPRKYEGVCLNPKDIPPDDLDDVILGGMIR